MSKSSFNSIVVPTAEASQLEAAPRATLRGVLKLCPFWPALLLISLLIPTEFSFSLGSLRLSPYRIVLLAAFVPCLSKLLSGGAGRLSSVDFLVLLHLVWSCIAIAYHHGAGMAAEAGGIRIVELGGGYLVARATIINEAAFRGVVAFILLIVSILVPFVIFECVSGIHVIKEISAKVVGTTFASPIGSRFGLARAYGPFDHPILLGVFAAISLGLARLQAIPALGSPRAKKFPQIAAVAAALSSMSAGPMAALMTQFLLLTWERRTRHIGARWKILSALLVIVYIVVDALSNRSGIKVFLYYLTFSAHTAYTRIIIFDYGIEEVWRHPWLGIGFNEWERPSWMHSFSMDNFWLLQAVAFGIPGFLTLLFATVLLLSRGWNNLSPRLKRLRTGWAISMIGIIIAACTVHLWNSVFVYLAFLLGAGAWFMNVKRNPLDSPVMNEYER